MKTTTYLSSQSVDALRRKLFTLLGQSCWLLTHTPEGESTRFTLITAGKVDQAKLDAVFSDEVAEPTSRSFLRRKK